MKNNLLQMQKKANYHIELIDNDVNFVEKYCNNFPSYNAVPRKSDVVIKGQTIGEESNSCILNTVNLVKQASSWKNNLDHKKESGSLTYSKSQTKINQTNTDFACVNKKNVQPYVPTTTNGTKRNRYFKRFSHNWSGSRSRASNHNSFWGLLKLESDSEKPDATLLTKNKGKKDPSKIIIINGKTINEIQEKEIKLDDQLKNKFKLRSRGSKLFISHQEMLDKICSMATQISKNNQIK